MYIYYLAHVDAGGFLALGMFVPQIGDDGNGTKSSIFC